MQRSIAAVERGGRIKATVAPVPSAGRSAHGVQVRRLGAPGRPSVYTDDLAGHTSRTRPDRLRPLTVGSIHTGAASTSMVRSTRARSRGSSGTLLKAGLRGDYHTVRARAASSATSTSTPGATTTVMTSGRCSGRSWIRSGSRMDPLRSLAKIVLEVGFGVVPVLLPLDLWGRCSASAGWRGPSGLCLRSSWSD